MDFAMASTRFLASASPIAEREDRSGEHKRVHRRTTSRRSLRHSSAEVRVARLQMGVRARRESGSTGGRAQLAGAMKKMEKQRPSDGWPNRRRARTRARLILQSVLPRRSSHYLPEPARTIRRVRVRWLPPSRSARSRRRWRRTGSQGAGRTSRKTANAHCLASIITTVAGLFRQSRTHRAGLEFRRLSLLWRFDA